MLRLSPERKMYYTLRIAVAMCFIGHGAFGIITKPIWCNYFAVFGIGRELAYQIMPPLGGIDILLGLVMLIYPLAAIPYWLIFWGLITAFLRPLAGEPVAEFIERAGNYGAPTALVILCGSQLRSIRSLFRPLKPDFQLDENSLRNAVLCLKLIVFLLIAGHGWLNLIEKKSLLDQYASLGFANPVSVAHIIGSFEILAAIAVLIRPTKGFLLILFIWKMASELFYPHYELFEWLERGGSYGTILALWFGIDALPNVLRAKKSSLPKIMLKGA